MSVEPEGIAWKIATDKLTPVSGGLAIIAYGDQRVATERARVQDLLLQAGAELIKMALANGLPGATPHQKAKNRATIAGMEYAMDAIKRAIGGQA